MKLGVAAAALVSLTLPAEAASPIGKVISMISDLQAKVLKEGEVAQKEYEEFSEWCEDRARNLGHEIKTGRAEAETLKATIAEETAKVGALTAKVDSLTARIGKGEKELKAATEIRAKEHEDFIAVEKEMTETIDMLSRGVEILEREMKGGASMLQATAGNLAQAFSVMVQASLLSTSDAAKLTAFVQDSENDASLGAPAAAVYESHSGDIVETLQGLQEKAEGQLADARKQETSSLNNFQMAEQSLQDELRFATQDLGEAKSGMAASSERKSVAAGDLGATSKDLEADLASKEELHHDCMSKATAFEAETRSRGEELKALAEAKKVIREATGAASLGQVSFVQLARSQATTRADQVKTQVLHLVRDLARKHSSGALMQLASEMSSAMHSQDPFAKVRGLISDMLAKLEQEAEADATKQAYCDKEMSETNAKKSDKSNDIKKLSTRIDRMSARSAELKEEVAALQNDLAKLTNSQAEMDQLRQKEKSIFAESSAELNKGLSGIKMALKVLNEYYGGQGKAHTASEGAASGILGLLEVCEADFSKNLAQITADEEEAAAEYEEVSKANQIENAAKTKDVKYKTQESKSLDKSTKELTNDRTGVQAELEAVEEYLAKLESECIAKAETYEDRKARRESEIAGLKDALQILESETAFIQRRSNRHALRGHLM